MLETDSYLTWVWLICFIQDAFDFGDDISLKNLLKKRKTKVKKRVNFVARGEGQETELEMERLCKIKGRLETMKQKLLRLTKRKDDGILDRSHMIEQSIVYVPVAVLKEKVWSCTVYFHFSIPFSKVGSYDIILNTWILFLNFQSDASSSNIAY